VAGPGGGFREVGDNPLAGAVMEHVVGRVHDPAQVLVGFGVPSDTERGHAQSVDRHRTVEPHVAILPAPQLPPQFFLRLRVVSPQRAHQGELEHGRTMPHRLVLLAGQASGLVGEHRRRVQVAGPQRGPGLQRLQPGDDTEPPLRPCELDGGAEQPDG
jgi:hypothetical protein